MSRSMRLPIEGALATFLKDSRADTDKMLADPKTPAAVRDQLDQGTGGDRPSRANPTEPYRDQIRPDEHCRPAARRSPCEVRGHRRRRLALRPAHQDRDRRRPRRRHCPVHGYRLSGGLEQGACEVAKVPFARLIPGHGPVMSRADFTAWRTAYDNFVANAAIPTRRRRNASTVGRMTPRSSSTRRTSDYAREAADYYLETRLRSSPEEQQKYCKPLRA